MTLKLIKPLSKLFKDELRTVASSVEYQILPSLLIPAAMLLVSLCEMLCGTMLLLNLCSRISDSGNALHDGDLHRL